MKLKADSIINLQDARFCSAEGFSLITFNFIRGDFGRVSADMIRDISGWISGTAVILEVGDELITDPFALPEDLEFDGLQSTDLRVLKNQENKNQHLILQTPEFRNDLPEGIWQQIPAASIPENADLSHTWIEISSAEEVQNILSGKIPFGLCFSSNFRDADQMLDFDRIHEVLDILESHKIQID